MDNMPNAEIAQHTVMNLFCRLPYASQKAYEWIAADDEMRQLCGYLLLARLFMKGMTPNERSANEFIDQARTALHASAPVRRGCRFRPPKIPGTGRRSVPRRGKKCWKRPDYET